MSYRRFAMKHQIKVEDFDFEFTGSLYTVKDVVGQDCPQLSGEELLSKIANKTIFGDYMMGYKFIIEFYEDGTAEGKNHVGSHNFGTWSIDREKHTMSTSWSNGWIDSTTRAYEINGHIQLFDIDTGNWRTTLKVMKGWGE